jgi:hypothetical protein
MGVMPRLSVCAKPKWNAMPTPRAILSGCALLVAWQPAAAQLVQCDLTVGSYGAAGACWLADTSPAPVGGPRQQLGYFWPADTVRIVVTSRPTDPPPWRGVFLLPDRQITFEIDREQALSTGRLVLRNPWAWVVVHEWQQTRATSGATLGSASLAFGLTEYPPASSDDIAILEATMKRLEELPSWDRQDDRDCSNDPPGHSSLFCVLVRAVEDRMGRYHHRQPALELVRGVINERWPDRWSNHQLMDFNNHPSTTMHDVRTVVEIAHSLARAEAAVRK